MLANFLMGFLRHRKEGEVRGFLIIQKMVEVGGWRNRTVLRKSLPRMINQSGRNKGESIERSPEDRRHSPPPEGLKMKVRVDCWKARPCRAV